MPLLVVDDEGKAHYSHIAEAIIFAADHGVRVINISIGGINPSITLQNAVDYAWNKGSIIFASAMNMSTDSVYYPAGCNRVVAVNATDAQDRLADFSNFGSWIKLSLPGSSILSTSAGGGYNRYWGTSFASPLAAGIAALVISVNPLLTKEQVVKIMEESAEDLGTPKFDKVFGWGLANAYKAVRAAEDLLPVERQPKRYKPQ